MGIRQENIFAGISAAGFRNYGGRRIEPGEDFDPEAISLASASPGVVLYRPIGGTLPWRTMRYAQSEIYR